MSYAFQAEGLVKRFGKTTALREIDLAVRTGEVHGFLGPMGRPPTPVKTHAVEQEGGKLYLAGLMDGQRRAHSTPSPRRFIPALS